MSEVGKKVSNLILKNREDLEIDGIVNISSLDDDYVALNSEIGKILIDGEGITVEDLNKETGKVKIKGIINSIVFSKVDKKSKRGIFS